MNTITLSGDEVGTLIALLNMDSFAARSHETTRDCLGMEIVVALTMDGILFQRAGHWRISEIDANSRYYKDEPNVFEFEGDEDEFRRDLVLTKIIAR